MKFPLLVAAALLSVAMASTSYASYVSGSSCNGGSSNPPECVGKTKLTDWTYFNTTYTSDTAGSTVSNGDLLAQPNGYGGGSAKILASTGDFVNWSHQFTFDPMVKQGGIIDAWITLSLRDFETDLGKKDDSDKEEHHDHEKDNEGNDRIQKGSCEYRVNFRASYEAPTCGVGSDLSNESAKLKLEGASWIAINDIDTGTKKFDVVLNGLYDGRFDVQLISTLNDFEIEWSKLEIEYCPETAAPVPEPSSIILLGAGLLGACLFRRRMRR